MGGSGLEVFHDDDERDDIGATGSANGTTSLRSS
jgi:hypothetical protein